MEYKATKIKGAVRLHGNEDPTLGMVQEFEEQAAIKCVEEFVLELDLEQEQKIKTEVWKCQIKKLEDEIN